MSMILHPRCPGVHPQGKYPNINSTTAQNHMHEIGKLGRTNMHNAGVYTQNVESTRIPIGIVTRRISYLHRQLECSLWVCHAWVLIPSYCTYQIVSLDCGCISRRQKCAPGLSFGYFQKYHFSKLVYTLVDIYTLRLSTSLTASPQNLAPFQTPL